MNHKNLFILLALLGGSLSASTSSSSSEDKYAFVQGGKCTQGVGTEFDPYNSLALAEADTTWTTLVVLPSTVALDGGIAMRPGTAIIGAKSPVKGALDYDQPTITNTSIDSNGGNGVVVTGGDVTVENIYFKDTWASAINYDNAHDLTVKNVLVTGYNQGELTTPVITRSNSREIGAFDATILNDGKSHFFNTVIRDGHTGPGIAEFSVGTKREMSLESCEMSGLRSFIPQQPGILRFNVAVAPIYFEFAKLKLKIEDCYFHDMAPNFDPSISTEVVKVESRQGSQVDMKIKNTSFIHNEVTGQTGGMIDISTFAFDDDLTASLPLSRFTSCIENCYFEEPIENSFEFIEAISHLNDNNAQSDIKIINNTFNNMYDNIITFSAGITHETYTITGNTGTGLDGFYTAISTLSETPNSLNTKVKIENNNFAGGNDFGAVNVVSGFSGDDSPWNSLKICLEHNCFDGLGSGFAGLAGYDFASNTVGAGNATINAHKNNITGFQYDIYDEYANVDYFAQKNWWGQPSGADSILNYGSGIVDVSHPLHSPIECPPKTYCIPDPIVQPTLALASKEKVRELLPPSHF